MVVLSVGSAVLDSLSCLVVLAFALVFAFALGFVLASALACSLTRFYSALACSLTRFSSAFALVLVILVHSLTILLNPFFSKTYLHHMSTHVVTHSESALSLVV